MRLCLREGFNEERKILFLKLHFTYFYLYVGEERMTYEMTFPCNFFKTFPSKNWISH